MKNYAILCATSLTFACLAAGADDKPAAPKIADAVEDAVKFLVPESRAG